MSTVLILVLSYNMLKKEKYNLNKKYDDNYMGNIFSKLTSKISDYRRKREERKIRKIYEEVFQDECYFDEKIEKQNLYTRDNDLI